MKSLLVSLGLLGSSAVALADHNPDQSQRRIEASYRQPGYQQPDRASPRTYGGREVYRPNTTWQALTSIERLERGGDVFDLRSRERFSQLRLQNQTGRTLVRRIDIVFADGSHQRVQIDRALDGNHAMVDVDLDGDARRIDKIFIDGRSARNASYQLYAM